MGTRIFSDKRRPVHLGPYPLERLKRVSKADLAGVPPTRPIAFSRPEDSDSLVNAMEDFQAMMDALQDGMVNKARADIPADPHARADHLKAFGYFNDAAMMGVCALDPAGRLDVPLVNPAVARLVRDLRTRQTKTLASGIDSVMADLRETMDLPPGGVEAHTHAIVILYENPRAPKTGEPGTDWLRDALEPRGALRANETACVIANYIRLLGWKAKAHSASCSDVCLNRLAVAAGLATVEAGELTVPWIGTGFGLAVITTALELAPDQPLAPWAEQPWNDARGPAWWLGRHSARSGFNRDPFARRNFKDGPYPFERIRRVDTPTTYIDEANVARVPKRTDLFARAQFGDMGKGPQDAAAGGHYARKSAPSYAQRRLLGAFVLLQDGKPAETAQHPADLARNAENIKAASYFLGADAVGISRCPDWAWYSHDALGEPLDPPHDQAISMIIDQGFETMEGASGDDWISVAQSMRAYLRFSLIGGVIAAQIRRLGYSAKAHTVMDGEVLQPPLLLLSGLGEVSRIGEVILNPYLGPRLKSGVVTTDMPLAHDKPIDFGLQNFCENCQKCARECPSGAITAGPKLMFNGYEIWKSDSQKCATYRLTNDGGSMCGRCMKTCPWNLEGLFAESPFRWAASNVPRLARSLAELDDRLGRGSINPVKKWWWDIEICEDGAYRKARKPALARGLERNLDLQYADQTLAVYPANLAPHPWPYPDLMDREAGIEAYQAMVTAEEYKLKLARGERDHLHIYDQVGDAPVIRVEVSRVEQMTDAVTKYEFRALDGGDLPEWSAGAHLDIVVVPEYLRQYSMSGDPADRKTYQIGVLREEAGRGGSKMLHRIFTEGRKVFVSKPINEFPLRESAEMTLLMGGGIGVTPMIAFAHRLHALGRDFRLHYSCKSRNEAGFIKDLAVQPWAEHVVLHISNEDSRADLDAILGAYAAGWQVYTCGPDRYMQAVLDTAERHGFPDDARHFEYFSAPEVPEYENHPFTLRLSDGREIAVAAQEAATEALLRAGVHVDVKCSDGICGVCKCRRVSGEVEHRDWVLSRAQRQDHMILCQSRAAAPDGVVEIEL